jgi:hypothetical protein
MNDDAPMVRECCPARPALSRTPQLKDDDRTADLVVIGATGLSAVISAGELGAKVTLIGHGTIGGTCVNIGRCTTLARPTPSKCRITSTRPCGRIGESIA